MKRLLLDTNIYGLIVEKQEREEFQKLTSNADVIIYGCSVIRKELRDIPKNERIFNENKMRNFRIIVLQLYDSLTKNEPLLIDERTTQLAKKYLNRFSQLTGKTALDHLKNDFLLVACASINNLNFIISEDHKTLFSQEATRTYQYINIEEGLTQPPIITYEEIKKLLKRWSP